jgi:hypothetical protein
VELKSLIFSFTIVFSLEMVHKPNIFMYKSTLKMTDLQGRILSSWLFSFVTSLYYSTVSGENKGISQEFITELSNIIMTVIVAYDCWCLSDDWKNTLSLVWWRKRVTEYRFWYSIIECLIEYPVNRVLVAIPNIYIYIYTTSEKPVNDQSYGVLDRYGIMILYK